MAEPRREKLAVCHGKVKQFVGESGLFRPRWENAMPHRVFLAWCTVVCHDDDMKSTTRWLALGATLATISLSSPAWAQKPVEVESSTPEQTKPPFEIVIPGGPTTQEKSRVPDADYYRDDQRVPYDPALIEPLTGTTKSGGRYGASGWTSPQTPVGSLASQIYQQNNGWFGFGFTFIWDSGPAPTPRPLTAPAPRPAAAPAPARPR